LIELLVAMAVFLIVAGTAFTLFNQHTSLATRQESLSGVNIGLRNAMTQLEIDMSSAGQNLLNSVPGATQGFSLGVIIQNNVAGMARACNVNTATWAYPTPSVCFDSLEVVNPKTCSGCSNPYPSYPYAPVLQIIDASDDLSATTTINASDVNPTESLSLATVASNYKSGDELLIVNPSNAIGSPPHCPSNAVTTSQSGFCLTVVTLTADAAVTGGHISLTHSLTGSHGQPQGCPGTTCSDPLGVVYDLASPNGYNFYSSLSPGSYGAGAYVVNLGTGANDIWYSVQANPTNSSDTVLMRCLGGPCNGANGQQLTDQVIGFKAGAALWNQADTTEIASYFYDASKYCNGSIETSTSPVVYADCTSTPPSVSGKDSYDFTLIRSVRISMVARTAPQNDVSLARFQNGFDNGPYLVQQASVVVDLRNMSMGQFGN
jgi:hypothetical protein